MMRRLLRTQLGQTGTEYMLVISVILVALVGAAYVFVPSFQDGTQQLANDVSTILDTHQINGMGANTTATGPGASGNANPAAANRGVANAGGTSGNAGNGGGNGGAGNGRGVYQETTAGTTFFERLFGITRTTTASSEGTGGQDGVATTITSATMENGVGLTEGSTGSYLKSDAQIAMEGSDLDPTGPNCPGALLAAIMGRTYDSAFRDELARGGYLETVRTETKMFGVTIAVEESTNGVMAASEMERFLREEADYTATSYSAGRNMTDVTAALDRGQSVHVLYDRGTKGELTGQNNHFARVEFISDWAPTPADGTPLPPGPYVVLDHTGGREYMPVSQFTERVKSSGGHVVTGTPPSASSNSSSSVASLPSNP